MYEDLMRYTNMPGLKLVAQGKVRDIYEIPGESDFLLIVATDRLSAYDVVLEDPIPGKGKVLTSMTLMWLELLKDIVPNHLLTANVSEYPEICQQYTNQLEGRSMIVYKVPVLPVECIVRGYLSGSFWNAYLKNPDVHGIAIPEGMKESGILPGPIFTPSTKAGDGMHDENISFDKMVDILDGDNVLAERVREVSLKLYERAASYAEQRGIIIADTKFEFGIYNNELMLVDEVLTPDSSRFWPEEDYEPGRTQNSFDKQPIRNYLSALDWNKKPPAPRLSQSIIESTAKRYQSAHDLLSIVLMADLEEVASELDDVVDGIDEVIDRTEEVVIDTEEYDDEPSDEPSDEEVVVDTEEDEEEPSADEETSDDNE